MLVIFDCDGVLVDSETVAFQTDNDMVRSLGLDWSVAECMQKFLGRSTKSCVEIIEAALGRPVPEGWIEAWHDAMHDSLRKNGVPYSENAVLTEYYDVYTAANGDTWLVVTAAVHDPQYLTTDFITSSHFKKLPAGDTTWKPEPCRAQ